MPLFAAAQTTDAQMATLQHGDKTTVFLGVDALVNAYNAAADSADVITLSAGAFNVPSEFSKSISVFGAGFENDTITSTKCTRLKGDVKLKHANSVDEDGNTVNDGRRVDGSHFEGLYLATDQGSVKSFYLVNNNGFAIKNVTIAKCKFMYLDHPGSNLSVDNLTIRQCRFEDIDAHVSYIYNNLYVTNCHFRTFGKCNAASTIHIDHCILKNQYAKTVEELGVNALVSNSILYYYLTASATAKSNIFIGATTTGTNNVNGFNWVALASAGVWVAEGEDGTYSAEKTFELKYPDKYIGTDGTQVGVHGGDYPWNKIPCTPRIIESNIDTKTSADGKLKVSIKVEAQTKE